MSGWVVYRPPLSVPAPAHKLAHALALRSDQLLAPPHPSAEPHAAEFDNGLCLTGLRPSACLVVHVVCHLSVAHV
jgi:hypothetical protein